MALNGGSGGLVAALAMFPGSASLALVVVDAPAPAPGTAAPPAAVVVPSVEAPPVAVVLAVAPEPGAVQGRPRHPMKWTNTTSGFVPRRLCS